jgi:hypothetical protein
MSGCPISLHGWMICGLAPRDAVVGAVAHDVLAQAAGEVEERLVAIPPEFRRVIVHVRAIPKERGGLPLALRRRADGWRGCSAPCRLHRRRNTTPRADRRSGIRRWRGCDCARRTAGPVEFGGTDDEGLRSFKRAASAHPSARSSRCLEKRSAHAVRALAAAGLFTLRPVAEHDAEADACHFTASGSHAVRFAERSRRVCTNDCRRESRGNRRPRDPADRFARRPHTAHTSPRTTRRRCRACRGGPRHSRSVADLQRELRAFRLKFSGQFFLREETIAETGVRRPGK